MTEIFASWKQLNLRQFMPFVTYLNIYSEVRIAVRKIVVVLMEIK